MVANSRLNVSSIVVDASECKNSIETRAALVGAARARGSSRGTPSTRQAASPGRCGTTDSLIRESTSSCCGAGPWPKAIPVRVQIKTPSQEPWSATAAPYAEWRKPQRFPIDEVLCAWGVQEVSEHDDSPAPFAGNQTDDGDVSS
jgi:hypothetical protein